MKYLKIILTCIALISVIPVFGQVTVQFIPEVYGRSLDGLMNVMLYNSSGQKSVRLSLQVRENKAGKILSIQTQPFTLLQGSNRIPAHAIKSAAIVMTANPISNFIRRNQYLPQGDYEYTFNVISATSSSEEIIEQTFSAEIAPPAPLDLIEPYNQEQICEKRPLLTWQPSIPKIPGILYEVLLVEMKERQNEVEALNYNQPIVKQKGVTANLLMFPPISKSLEEGKKYAWQVTAYTDQTVINRSEVWSFKVSCQDTTELKPEPDNGYRDIEDLIRGNYYVAEGSVKFAVLNPYQDQKLKYEILCLTNPDRKIRRLPNIVIKRGQNKIKLNLVNNMAFEENYSYLLKIRMPDGTQKTLRFIYKTTL